MKNKNETELKDYNDIIEELEFTKPNNHLLLGNGFNLSLGIKTDYKSIFNKMKENNKDYETVILDNFDLESFIGECKSNIIKINNKNEIFMKNYYHNKIKFDFMKAVSEIVYKEIKKIKQLKDEPIYLFLKQFDTFFTLNYDPFLYQLLMSYKKEDKENILVFNNALPFIEEELIDDVSLEILNEIKKSYESGYLEIKMDVNNGKKLDLNKLTKAEFEKERGIYYKDKISNKQLKEIIDIFWKGKDIDKIRGLEKINDGFSLFENNLAFYIKNTQNLFFLHGAFHIYEKNKVVI